MHRVVNHLIIKRLPKRLSHYDLTGRNTTCIEVGTESQDESLFKLFLQLYDLPIIELATSLNQGPP